jgi:hypothetical protein
MKENRIRQTGSTYRPYNRKQTEQKTPGKIVGAVAVFPHIIYLTVNKERKDYKIVLHRTKREKHVKLPKYEQSLFYSCFKNWS